MLCLVYTRVVLLFMLAAGAAYAAGGTITYRWVDADGIHFSDQPHPGAEQITLGRAPVYSNGQEQAQSPPAAARSNRAASDSGDFRYDSCTVAQPAQDQVLVDARSVTIAVQANPPKRNSDRVVLSLDGRAIEPANNDQQEFTIDPIDRGTHTVVATVRGADGRNLCQSAAVSFHVRQPAIRRQQPQPLPR
jgi:hypothetical protein